MRVREQTHGSLWVPLALGGSLVPVSFGFLLQDGVREGPAAGHWIFRGLAWTVSFPLVCSDDFYSLCV